MPNLKAKLIHLALSLMIGASFIVVSQPTPVLAQVPTCADYLFPYYSFGWRVQLGTISGDNVTTTSLNTERIQVDLLFPDAQYVTTVNVFTFMDILSLGSSRVWEVDLFDANGLFIESKTSLSGNAAQWEGWQAVFDIAKQINHPIGRVSVFMYPAATGNADVHGAALHVGSICTLPQGDTVTATGTVFSNPTLTGTTITDTPHPTFTPSNTPTASRTYTPTRTPTPTWTPGGPSPTPSPTKTLLPSFTPSPSRTRPASQTPGPSPTSTASRTRTATGVPASSTPFSSNTPGGPTETAFASIAPQSATLSGELFSTIAPPKGCSDITNPCGALPAVPGFPTFNLPSPVAVTAVGLAATATFHPFGTASTPGTPGPTSTSFGNEISTMAFGYKNQVSTLAAQPTGEFIIAGTPQTISGLTTTLGDNAGTFVGYVKGIGLIAQSRLIQILLFLVLIVVFIILIELLIFFIPLIIQAIKFVISLIELIPFV